MAAKKTTKTDRNATAVTATRSYVGRGADLEHAMVVQWLRKRAASLEARSKDVRTKFDEASNAARVRAGIDMVHAGLLRDAAESIVNGEHRS
jgi:hypothetical protein